VRSRIEEEYGSVEALHAELLRFIDASSRIVEQIEREEREQQIQAALRADLAR
jgi:hypothetical protein